MRLVILVLAILLPALTLPAHAQEVADIPRLEPGSADAKPLTVYQWTAKAGNRDEDEGFRFTWRLPKDFKRTEPYDLVVICHGNGKDYTWGAANLDHTQFRPNNIIVCPDGTAEADDAGREFRAIRRDVIDFRDFVLEMSRTFPVDRIFLYGHAEGSAFVVYMATAFPGITEGIVADATGSWGDWNLGGGLQSIPVALLYGTANAGVPHYQSLACRDLLRNSEHPMYLARRIQDGDHRPNWRRVSECIDWCAGMSTTRADTALAAAEALMRPVDPSEPFPPALGGAAQVLRRVTLETEFHVEEVDDEQKAKARAMLERIDAAGARHVEALKKDIKSGDDLVLGLGSDSGAWLGHLVALREDFRGVPSVEAFIKEIGFDAMLRQQRDAAAKIVDVWFAARPEKYKFEVVGNNLVDAFLSDALPSDLGERMAELKSRAGELGLTEESIEKYGMVEVWSTAWKNGYKRYVELCR